jgi:hypothetical protein
VLAQDDAARAQARAEFSRGVARYDAGDFQGALEAFQEAYRLAPHPSVRVNMANSYEQLGRPLEAMFHFERFLEEAESVRPQQRSEIDAALARLRGRIGEVTLSVEPPGATIVIDGTETRRAPVNEPVRLVPGNHTLEVTAEGYATMRRELIVEAGQPATVHIELVPAEASGEVAAPTPAVETSTDAEASAGVEAELPPITDDGGGGFQLSAPVIIAGGATVALLLGAAVTGLAAVGANSDFEDAVELCDRGRGDPAACDEGRDSASSASTLALVTDILLVGGLVGAGVTAYLIATQSSDEPEAASALRITPVASHQGGGLLVSGEL